MNKYFVRVPINFISILTLHKNNYTLYNLDELETFLRLAQFTI